MADMESPLLKLRQDLIGVADSYAHQWGHRPGWYPGIEFLLREAEERWELERQLHKDQVRKIRKQRHEYIMYLRTVVWLLAEDLYQHGCAWAKKGFDTDTGMNSIDPRKLRR